MSDELKAAANRFRSLQYCRVTTGNGVGNPAHWPIEQLYWDDAVILARAYLADLAAREAEERERAIPIDEEWLLSLGFEYVRSHIGPEYGDDMQLDRLAIWDFNGECWLMTESDWFEMTTRGQILDLMRVTKTEAKGGAA